MGETSTEVNHQPNIYKRNRLPQDQVSRSADTQLFAMQNEDSQKAVVMQRELDDFAEFFDGPLSEEEQDLIKQLKERESEIDQRFKTAANSSSE